MPELPEVETVRRGLSQSLKGLRIRQVILHREALRLPIPKGFAVAVTGRRLIEVRRRAKYLLLVLEDGDVILAHLGMSGRMLVTAEPPKHFAKHDHVVLIFEDSTTLVFNDARRFGIMVLTKEDKLHSHPLLAALGPEPFSAAFNASYLAKALERRSGPIKTALMDQALVVGVGNIYASEALFCAGIAPTSRASACAGEAAKLMTCIRKVLRAAIDSGGSTLRDYVRSDGDTGYFQHRFCVYDREGKSCTRCRTPIQKITQAGRSTFFCPRCQKLFSRSKKLSRERRG